MTTQKAQPFTFFMKPPYSNTTMRAAMFHRTIGPLDSYAAVRSREAHVGPSCGMSDNKYYVKYEIDQRNSTGCKGLTLLSRCSVAFPLRRVSTTIRVDAESFVTRILCTRTDDGGRHRDGACGNVLLCDDRSKAARR